MHDCPKYGLIEIASCFGDPKEECLPKIAKAGFLRFAYQNKQLVKQEQDSEHLLGSSCHSVVKSNCQVWVDEYLAAVCYGYINLQERNLAWAIVI